MPTTCHNENKEKPLFCSEFTQFKEIMSVWKEVINALEHTTQMLRARVEAVTWPPPHSLPSFPQRLPALTRPTWSQA